MTTNNNNFNQFTLEDRITLENLIKNEGTCKVIAGVLNKNDSSIRREIKRNRTPKARVYFNNPKPFPCDKLNKFPYVCNGCPDLGSCRKSKYLYNSNEAHEQAQKKLKFSRTVSHFDDDTFEMIDNTIKNGVELGQPISHIIKANKLPVSKSSIYRWISDGIMTTTKMDLQKAIRYNTNQKDERRIRDYSFRKERKYEDYISFTQEYPHLNTVEMDTVEGLKTDSKCILTFVCKKSKLFFARLMNNQRAESVVEQFNILEKTLGLELFKNLFGCVLTDNGKEFSSPEELDFSPFTGERRTHVFYCDPQRSDQKGTIERKHVDLRLITPKKKSIDFITQEKVELAISHVNAILKPDLNNRSTFQFASFLYNEELLSLLNIQYIPPNDVHLKPSLLK